MRRSFLVRVAIVSLLGFALLAILAKVVVERGRRPHASAPASEPSPRAESNLPSETPSVASVARVPALPPRLIPPPRPDLSVAARPSPPAAVPPETALPAAAAEEIMEELGTVQREITRLQFQIVMLESKAQMEEAQGHRTTLGDLEKRAAMLREKAGLPPAGTNPAYGPIVPR
jgi:hypothetical protein